MNASPLETGTAPCCSVSHTGPYSAGNSRALGLGAFLCLLLFLNLEAFPQITRVLTI